MAVYNDWSVEYLNGSTWTEIPYVQNVSCSVGRRTAIDQWPASTASVRVWYPDGWTNPFANLTAGTKIRLFAPGRSSTKPSWTGQVKDLAIEVGIPWNSSTSDGNADFLTIECEGYIATAGRYQKTESVQVMQFDGVDFPIRSLVDDWLNFFYGPRWTVSYNASSPAITTNFQIRPTATSSQFWTANPLLALQQFVAFGQFRLVDGVRKSWATGYGNADDAAMYIGAPSFESPVATVGFSDTTNNATNRLFDQIDFDSLADQYYNAATITYGTNRNDPSVVTTVSSDLGITPLRTFTTQFPTAEGPPTPSYLSMTEYLSQVFSPPDIGISSISATTNGQQTQNLDTLGVTDLELGYLPLYIVPVTLRGQTFYCQIEGVQVTADTNSTRFTYYVTPTGTAGWFTLDSAALGVLDENRFGIY